MPLAPILRKAYRPLVLGGALYFVFLSLLLNGWIQRQALYAHKVHTVWWQDPNNPELFGFLRKQVLPFTINTTDGENLYAWHILPLATYARNEVDLLDEPADCSHDANQRLALNLLSTDPESRLVINFHGNAGTVAQGWRTDTYRALYSGAPDKIHVLAVDYRGFGYSSGAPTEQGLIIDGISVVNWALHVARIPPERIIIFGQSLGTAVSIAVVEHFVLHEHVEFAGIVLVAGFSDIPTLMTTYAVGGIIPILSPLKTYPTLQKFFASRVQETWYSAKRLESLVRHSKSINLRLIHARNDFDIPSSHSKALFYAAANGTTPGGMAHKTIDALSTWYEKKGSTRTWDWKSEHASELKKIRLELVEHGGHNRLPTYAVAAKAVINIFDL